MLFCIAGKNEIAVHALLTLIDRGIDKELICVIPNSTDTGHHTWQPSVRYIALKHGIKICNVQDIYDIPDIVFISLEFDKLVNVKKFKSTKLFNIHFSLLPAYKGMYTSVLPILNSDKTTGVTLHRIDNGIDTGEIIDQIEIEIHGSMNSLELYNRYLESAKELFNRNYDKLLYGPVKSIPQSSVGSSYYSKNSINFESIDINLIKTAQEIHNQVRAYSFRPYQLPVVNDTRISHSEVTVDRSTTKPGKTLQDSEIYFRISSIDYDIILYKDQMENAIIAAKNDDYKYIKHLLSFNYKLSEHQDSNLNAFLTSIIYGSIKTFTALIEAGQNPNLCSSDGISALMYATELHNFEIMERLITTLIQKGASLTYKNHERLTAIDYATQNASYKAINMLKKYLV